MTKEPRANITDRRYRVYTYQDVDRVPDVEFGYWPQTVRRWLKEGLSIELSPEEINSMFSAKVNRHFGFDGEGCGINLRVGMYPPFEEEVIERKEHSVIMRDAGGCLAESYPHDEEESSIPHFIDFPVKTPGDWATMKERYRNDGAYREIPSDHQAAVIAAAQRGTSVSAFSVGMYGQLRQWMGFENLSYAFYECPDMIHDMVDHWSRHITLQIERLDPEVPIDEFSWWEDMAGKNGPFVGPDMFREFLQPGYHRVMETARKRGCVLGCVDSDGDPHDIARNWLEEGVNIILPFERAAGCDPLAWRREFGKALRIQGGIDKRLLVECGGALDRELDRLKPLLEEGGVIPHLDHLVPPDVSYTNFQRYLQKKRKLIGRDA